MPTDNQVEKFSDVRGHVGSIRDVTPLDCESSNKAAPCASRWPWRPGPAKRGEIEDGTKKPFLKPQMPGWESGQREKGIRAVFEVYSRIC